MFKKAIALTLALVMLIMPMTASAVSWSKLVGSLKSESDKQTVEGTTIERNYETFRISDGTVEFDDLQNWVGAISGLYIFRNVTLKDFNAYMKGDGMEIYFEEGTIAEGTVHLVVDMGSTLSFFNKAQVNGDVVLDAYADADGGIWNDSKGVIDGALEVYTEGKGTSTNLENYGSANQIILDAIDGGLIEVVNESDVDSIFAGSSNGSMVKVDNFGDVGNGIANLYNDGEVLFTGDGTYASATVNVAVDGENTYSQEEIAEIISNTGIVGTEKNNMTLVEVHEDRVVFYEIEEDGSLSLIEEHIFEEEEDESEPQPEPDPIEEQRQAEAIGGVTTSPVWNWQGYLGHSSKPMWIYVNGEKVLMRQRLFWVGDGTKNHTCRIRATEPDPASVELRVGLDMLRTAQRAEISVISILDENGNAIAQFAVSDLLGAFEQYGLVEGELLCVSADADAEVMKVTLDGEYLPLEA